MLVSFDCLNIVMVPLAASLCNYATGSSGEQEELPLLNHCRDADNGIFFSYSVEATLRPMSMADSKLPAGTTLSMSASHCAMPSHAPWRFTSATIDLILAYLHCFANSALSASSSRTQPSGNTTQRPVTSAQSSKPASASSTPDNEKVS